MAEGMNSEEWGFGDYYKADSGIDWRRMIEKKFSRGLR
jgi:hypothetical protein